MFVPIFRLFSLLSVAVIVAHAIYTEEPVEYDFCQCPCTKAETPTIDAYFETKAACTYLRNDYSHGYMFTADDAPKGRRQVYHDVTHRSKPGTPTRRPHSAFWKAYYPWRNYTGYPDFIPQVIQNVLTLEFVTWTNVPVPQSNHELITIPKLTSEGLWQWWVGTSAMPTYGYKMENIVSHEFIEADERLTGSRWNEGRVFTDILKRNRSDLYQDKFAWFVEGCFN